MKNPYETLGVDSTASTDALQSAYRQLAKKLHPDLNPGNKAAEEEFKQITAAYDLLKDPEKRRRYDAGEIDETGQERPQQRYYRDYAGRGQDPYADFSGFSDYTDGDDPFAELLRRSQQARANRRGEDRHYRMEIPFSESISGAEKRLTLPDGSVLDVKVPAGLVDGQTLRLKGKGDPGRGTGGPGDALIEIEVLPDPRFTREGDDITIELPVSVQQAVLGGQVRVPTATGEVMLTVPKGSNSGTKLRLRGKGVPRRGGGAGDQYVVLKVMLPKPPDPEFDAFVAKWAEAKEQEGRA